VGKAASKWRLARDAYNYKLDKISVWQVLGTAATARVTIYGTKCTWVRQEWLKKVQVTVDFHMSLSIEEGILRWERKFSATGGASRRTGEGEVMKFTFWWMWPHWVDRWELPFDPEAVLPTHRGKCSPPWMKPLNPVWHDIRRHSKGSLDLRSLPFGRVRRQRPL
jgi:hypothetical protein